MAHSTLSMLNPYQSFSESCRWEKIHHWRELDFVKALPQEIKQKLEQLPPEAEVEHIYSTVTGKIEPTVNPERSRAYWLQRYCDMYQPFREKNRAATLEIKKAETSLALMEMIARISETLERINRNVIEIHSFLDSVWGTIKSHP